MGSARHTKVLYELSMSIGAGFDLRSMLDETLSVFLGKLNCSAGGVLHLRKDMEGRLRFYPVFFKPKNAERLLAYKAALRRVPVEMDEIEAVDFLKGLPLAGRDLKGRYFHVFEMPDFGLLVLLKDGRRLQASVVESLPPLLKKLGDACNTCLRNEEHERMYAKFMELSIEILEKTADLEMSKDAMLNVMNDMKETEEALRKDIEKRKLAETALKESRNKFEMLTREFNVLLDAIPDSLVLLSPDLKVLWANSGALQSVGKPNNEIAGLQCHELFSGRRVPCKDCPTQISFDTGEAVNAQSTRGGRFLDVRTFPIKDESGSITSVIKVEIDITEKINLQEEAVRAAHLASIGELAAGVAHEINNPINAIINYAQILFDDASGAGDASGGGNDIAKRIMKEGERIAGIVRSLLSFARVREKEMSPVNLLEIVFDTLSLIEAQLRHDGIKLEVGIPPHLPHVTVNSQQIQQVFLNILNNSRYALNQKHPKAHEDKVLEIRGEEECSDGKSYLKITFRDHGMGIPLDIIDRVMNPFFTTKPGGKGTGLGLSISHGIINNHGGKLKINSSEGKFTEVSICLPVGGENGEDPCN